MALYQSKRFLQQADLKGRQQVNPDQLKGLLEFLNENQQLAKGLTRGRRGNLHSVKLWNVCAKQLNNKDGAVKDGKGWAKYWCDWKYRVRRRALELKVARDNNRPPPEGVLPLTHMEEDIMQIIGENADSPVVINTDPLASPAVVEDVVTPVAATPANASMKTPVSNAGTDASVTAPKRGRKNKRPPSEPTEADDEVVIINPPLKKRKVPIVFTSAEDQSEDESATELIRLEREKLEYTKQFLETTREISGHMGKLVSVMTRIKDILKNR